ncbi:50S ribosomal protein L3 N(5)-glutamine methyltransferase [Candidatus Riesia pediculischaeffi]|uniref:Protein-(Glutamine-N5) methyltransferase, ribosomal protein L3-specific n=2 Tax=Candidatus Riesia pediculischaeffi TaxID=428411 RepID=A0A1V0HK20_9ENTR|nr:50S ribosomal protein L3 N(5)-glutamine methyltransferase [Candidatus Riesia pediculischaeffi]ARC53174.1 protein-(glutamine-N5) methyltransferase, ribosomal protein L3-specific [Candidatus Riesia pediculischaeffi]KIE64194.1 Ribosomal protein L3 methyltransferase [Candidatus Riesia pediculischaeffi PTSU]
MENKFKMIRKEIMELYTIKDVLRWMITKLNSSNVCYGQGTDNSFDEAVYILFSTIRLPTDIPEVFLSSRLTTSERKKISEKLSLRMFKRIPSAYLTKKIWFCGHEFFVDKRVFIPRSPISELIDDSFKSIVDIKPKKILDLCTGSGCIAISCAYAFEESEIDASDISIKALEVARKNVTLHSFSKRINLIQSDLFKDVPSKQYDLIITNPPYVDCKTLKFLPKEYRAEPSISLKACENGLKFIKIILKHAPYFLSEKGVLLCEVGKNIINLINLFPEVDFEIMNLKNKGNGVFCIKKEQLSKNQHFF